MKKIFISRRSLALALVLQCLFCIPKLSRAQGYIGMSTQIGGSGSELLPQTKVINGYTYVYGMSGSTNYPTTPGAAQSSSRGNTDLVVSKFKPDGTLVYSTYLGGSGYESNSNSGTGYNNVYDNTFVVSASGEVYLVGDTYSPAASAPGGSAATTYPVTITSGIGASPLSVNRIIVVTKLNADGSIAYSRYIAPGSTPGSSFGDGIAVHNGEAYIYGFTTSATYPVVGNSTAFTGTVTVSDNRVITKLDASGNIVYSAYMGRRTGGDKGDIITSDATGIYIAGTNRSTNNWTSPYAPVNLNAVGTSNGSQFVLKLDFNCTQIYNTLLGNDGGNLTHDLVIDNGNAYISGYTLYGAYPSTNGSVKTTPDNNISAFVAKVGPTGSIGFYGYIDGSGVDAISNSGIAVEGGITYLAFATDSPNLPVTDGSTSSGSSLAYFKLSSTGSIISGTYLCSLGSGGYVTDLKVLNGEAFIGLSAGPGLTVTNNSTSNGQNNIAFVKAGTDNKVIFSSYIDAGNLLQSIIPYAVNNIFVENSSTVYITGNSTSPATYPVTVNPAYSGGDLDFAATKLILCPSGYTTGAGAVTPSTQTVCKNGLAQRIVADSIYLPLGASGMPVIYKNGVSQLQDGGGGIKYQWQRADAPAGPWSNIADGILKDYLPSVGGTNQYYRRIASTTCHDTLASSSVASVLVNANTAAVVNAGGSLHTCPGTAVVLGGAPTASGGLSPFTYAWDNGLPATANPGVTITQPTIYTLTVTDANGCKTLAQAVVAADTANAGADKSFCGGTSGVRIGTPAIAGLAGVTYSWSPAAGLSCTNCAQPMATPATTTEYTLTVTLPVNSGGTCSTTDKVIITPVAAPATANFAGADVVTCLSGNAALGTAAESGFTYTWSPGTYLTGTTFTPTTYLPGNFSSPSPNPITYYLTAAKAGCYFVDSVKAAGIEARAGLDGCGPRLLGMPDRTPSVNETYSWTIVSGPGTFVGGATTSSAVQPAVGSMSSPTVFRLTVTYTIGGVTQSCTDDVTVGACGCQVNIQPFGPHGCPSFNLSGGANTTGLTATPQSGDPSQYSYSWSPAAGLSATTGQTVYLTDAVNRTYTCTITSLLDPSFTCSNSYAVNNPAWTLPVFTAMDVVTCPNTAVAIGQTAVANYSYLWTPAAGLSSATASNPTATVAASTDFDVKVTETTSGCYINDQSTVTVIDNTADAGPDWYVCDNAIVKLGTAAQPNTTYSWSPAAPWQNGTNATSAQPEVLIAANLTFTVTATNTLSGCVSTDQVSVFVNNNPTITNFPDVSACKGTGIQIGAPALPGVTYSWSPAAGLSNANIAQPIAAPNATTTYIVTAVFPGSCASAATDMVTVTVHDPSFTLAPVSYCPSAGAVSLGATAPAGMSAYSWSPASLVSNAAIANPTTLNPPPSVTTTYRLTVTDAFGCGASNNITITPTVAAPIAGNNKTVCLGSSVQLGSPANPASATYSWSPATGLDNPSSAAPTFTPAAAGTTTFTVTKTEAGCTSTATVQVMVNSFKIPALASPTVCNGSCVTIGTTPAAGASYAWSPAAGLSNASIANPTACVASTTAYTLTALGANGCADKQTVVVGVSASPAPTVSIPPVNACFGKAASFAPSINPAGSYDYLWTPNDGKLSSVYVLNPQILTSATGTTSYGFSVTNTSNGCAGNAIGTVTVTMCAVPVKIEEFTAAPQGSNVILNWLAGEEINVLKYEVEFSTTNSGFRSIGTKPATGSHHYSMLHTSPAAGTNYYRLKITDKDGAAAYSDVRKVNMKVTGSASVYPNPVNTGILNVSVQASLMSKAAVMTLIAPDGRVVLQKRISSLGQTESLDVSRLANGQYYLRIATDGNVINKPVVVLR